MTFPQNSGNTPARPNESASTNDPQLNAAVTEAGQHPERAAALAAELGLRFHCSPSEAERRVNASGHHPTSDEITTVVNRLTAKAVDMIMETQESHASFGEVTELGGMLASSEEVGIQFDVLHGDLIERGWIEPTADPTKEANLRADFDLIAARFLRVGYVAAQQRPRTKAPVRKPEPPFSFAEDERFLAEIPLPAFESGLEMAALEERHFDALGFVGDYTIQLIEKLKGIRKLRQAIAELEKELESTDLGQREYGIGRYTARIMRASFEAGRRHSPQNDTPLDELVDLFRRKIHTGAIDDDVLASMDYWTMDEVDAARRIVRLETNSAEHAAYHTCVDAGITESDLADDNEPVCGATDGGWTCNRKAGHDGSHVAVGENPATGEDAIGRHWTGGGDL